MKNKIIPFLAIFGIAFALSGCAQSPWLYRVNVQQGNVIPADLVHHLRRGMTKDAVCDLLGPPLLMDTFNDNRWNYNYFFKSGKGKLIERSLTVYFRNNCVVSIKTRNIS